MPVTSIEGRTIHVDPEGFLTDYAEWDEQLARALARQIGIELTEAHWTALRFLRHDYQQQHETATLRRVSKGSGLSTKALFDLFPAKPAKKMAYVAGLPKPRGCV